MYDGVASLIDCLAAVHSQPSPEPEGLHVLAKYPAPPRRLRLVVLHDSAPVLTMLCQWLEQHGHHCHTALLADMPRAHEEVGQLIPQHRPDVVIYDVGMHYASSWDLSEGDPNVAGASVAAIRHYDARQGETRTRRGGHSRHRDRRPRYRFASTSRSGRSSGRRCPMTDRGSRA